MKIILKISFSLFILLINAHSSAQQITGSQSGYGLKINDSTILENGYDTIYNPLINEVGPIKGINGLDDDYFVYAKDNKYGFVILYTKKNRGEGYQKYSGQIDSLEISEPIYDSIYWLESISRYSSWSKEKNERYRSLVYLQTDDKFGCLFLYWADNRNTWDIEYAGLKSSTSIAPKYDSIQFDKDLILILNDQYGIIFSDGQIIEPVFDSLKQVHPYYPFNQYYYVWQNGKCGLIKGKKLCLPIVYSAQYLVLGEEKYVIINTPGEPYTLFYPEDSTYIRIKASEGYVQNNDSINTYFQLNHFIDSTSVIEVTRYYNIGPKYDGYYPEFVSYGGIDDIYLIDDENGSLIAAYSDNETKYISFGDIVISIKPKNKKRTKFKITLFKKYEHTEIASYDWAFNPKEPPIEFDGFETDENDKEYSTFGYYNTKNKFIQVGYLNTRDRTFKKRLKLK